MLGLLRGQVSWGIWTRSIFFAVRAGHTSPWLHSEVVNL